MQPQAETASRFSPDAWLTETFGRPVFRLSSRQAPGAEEAAAEMARLAGSRDAFFYAKLPTSDVSDCIALVNAGFHVIDTAITLAWRGGELPAATGISAALAKQDQLSAIPEIAGNCFRWSRFHQDPRIPASLANRIKRRWMENYVLGNRGSALYAVDIGGAVAGFLAVMESTVERRPVAVIDLVGVAPVYQGRGVGAALLRAFMADWRGRVSELRVGTQAANIRSISLYESRGFRIVESNYVLHAHFLRGEICR